MNAARHFKSAYSTNNLFDIFIKKILYKSNIGMDRVTPEAFKKDLMKNIETISQKVLSGKYKFTRYREVLISKGRGKEPRVISIPTIRDKLALCACHQFIQKTYSNVIEEPLLHTIVNNITKEILQGKYDGFVKIDISHFYGTINHQLLMKKIKRKIRKPEALHLISEAISTDTIPRTGSSVIPKKNEIGIPEGLSISNILADIFLSDFEKEVHMNYNVSLYRYVDDILILCPRELAEEIKDYCIALLKNDFYLNTNDKKTMAGRISKGIPYLGYIFYDNKVGIQPSSVEKLESSIEDLFRLYKNKVITKNVFEWRLNLRITGCIFDSKKYGWLFYYSQLTDLQILFHLDWLIDQLYSRYGFNKPKNLKKFVRAYHEITKNVSNSKYIVNADNYSMNDKINVLSNIYGQKSINNYSDEVEKMFKEAMFKEIQRLEYDIQNFS